MYRCPMYKFSQESFKVAKTPALGHTLHCLYSDIVGKEKLPLVMVHGALVSRRYLMPTAELLAGHLPVYVPDLAGHGQSSKVERVLSVPEQARVLKAWMVNTGLPKVNLLGHSYGSEIVGEFAAQYPEMINKLVLASPCADPNFETLLENFFRLVADGIVEHPLMPLILFRDLFEMGIDKAFATAQEMMAYSLRDTLPFIRAKTLVIRGTRDFLVSQPWVEEICDTVKHARLDIVPDGPHSINFSTPEEFAPALLEFLDK